MRTIVDIPEDQLGELSALCKRADIPRAEAIRRAVSMYLDKNRVSEDQAFGIWKDRGLNSRDYEDALRQEWER